MIDLKPYFDAAQAANDDVQRLMSEMNAAFGDGTEDGKTRAMAMRPTLDAAKAKAEEANTLYISMRNAASVSDEAAKLFVPVSNPNPAPDDSGTKTMTREAFLALDSVERMAFIRDGGTLID